MRKVYHVAKTPYQKLIELDVLSADDRDALQRLYRSLNPVRLKRQLDSALEALWVTADPHPDRRRSVTVTSDTTYDLR